MTVPNRFSTLAGQRRSVGGSVRFVVTDDWLQVRTCYGGLISALAVVAMRDQAGATWPAGVALRALQTCFVGPASPGQVDIGAIVLRPAATCARCRPRSSSGAPAFVQHFDMRWAEGPLPYSGGKDFTSCCIHMRLTPNEAASVPSELQPVLLGDLSPTPVIGQLTRPSANSSVTWALELRPVDSGPAEGWWRADNESLMVDGGYVNRSARHLTR